MLAGSMFGVEGLKRSERHNQALAGYLAGVAGLVNSAGFVLIGSFTSHVTGNVGRLADNLAGSHHGAAVLAASMVGAFFVGAFVASMALESNVLDRRPHVYAALLVGEAALLGAFLVLASTLESNHPRLQDSKALFLCGAMGMQNSLVTRLSGAVVRTTHLTGVVTDLGIETARWFRFWRARLGERTGMRLTFGKVAPSRPHAPKAVLLVTVLSSFVLGSVAGATLAVGLGRWAVLAPIGLLALGAGYAWWSGQSLAVGDEARK
jgi:uncharacterized membrane protein YoaK (UPF0700 family)